MQSEKTDGLTVKLFEQGDKFGDYTVVKLLGKGGMGAVYLMRGTSGAEYAVKIMFPEKVTHEMRRRFAHEAEFAIKIRHKNLVSVYDVGEDPETDLCYMIMDYVAGGSLSDMLKRRGRLPIGEAVSIFTQIAAALNVAHSNGLVHRDIKPDNILFDADGTPRLADLGVAKFEDPQQSMVTSTGMIIGTPAYMAPEQMLNSHQIDARADIYALGVVLYEMLSGKRPNEGRTAIELMAKAIKGEPLPDIKTICPDVAVPVAHVVSLMCAPKPELRPQTALAAAELLRKAASGKLVLVRKKPQSSTAEAAALRAKRSKPVKGLAIGIGVAALLFVGIAGWVKALNRPNLVKVVVTTPATNVQERVAVVTNVVERTVVDVVEKTVTNVVDRTKVVTDANGVARDVGWERTIASDDQVVRTAKIGDYTWYYTLKGGKATIGRNRNALVAISPLPRGRVVVPASIDGHDVTTIGKSAFWGCGMMTDVVLPERLEEIDHMAFGGCTNLTNVKIPAGVTKIDPTSFFRCSGIAEFVVADGNPVFKSESGLLIKKDDGTLRSGIKGDVTIPHGVKSIGNYAFAFNKQLNSVVIPASVIRIGDEAFNGCDGLVEVMLPEGVADVGCASFQGCRALRNVTIPSSVKALGRFAFLHCRSLASVTFNGNAPRVGDKCFGGIKPGCTAYVKHGSSGWGVDIPGTWQGMSIAYAPTKSAEPDKNARMKQRSTTGRAKTRIVFPRLDRSPNAWAYSFEKEEGWEKSDFDDSRWKRAQGGIGSCENQRQIPRARFNTKWDSERVFLRRRFNWSGGDVSRMMVDAFHDDDATVYLNGRFVLSISGSCNDWQPFEIPADRFVDALKVGENVFCVEVRDQGGSKYFDCGLLIESGGQLDHVTEPDGIRKVNTAEGTWTVLVVDGVAQIGDGDQVALEPRPKGVLRIPEELGGMRIRKLASRCFFDCSDIEYVVLPEGIRSVGLDAFYNCSKMARISIPESLEHLGIQALHGTSLKKVDIKNVRLLEGGVFRSCDRLDRISVNPDNLTFCEKDGVLYDKVRRAVAFCPRSCKSYVFPSTTEEVYDCAFQRSMIKHVVFPNTVRIVGNAAFQDCPFLETVKFKGLDAIICGGAFCNTPSLKSVILPSRLKELDDWAIFQGAGQLETIMLPDTVEVIDDAVFASCPKLKNIYLGKSLRYVDIHAFSWCPQLQEISFPATLKVLRAEAFVGSSSLRRVTFAGNAPELQDNDDIFGRDIYKGTSESLVTVVPRGSTGWLDASSNLPKVWPVDGGESARQIRHGR